MWGFNNSLKNKIFCISFQRTGTTSVGQFFKDHNFSVAGYNTQRSSLWSKLRFIGDYEKIFKSSEFKKNQVFEDNPWFENDFYKFLYHRFPDAKFILFTRDSDKWFNSMMSHSKGKTLGNTFRHAHLYDRLDEYYINFPNYPNYKNLTKIDNLLELSEKHREHYKNIYNLRNRSILEFFNSISPNSLFSCQLEDPEKWNKLAAFFDIPIAKNYKVHANKTNLK